MKKLKVLILIVILALACSNNDDTVSQGLLLVGEWKLIEYYGDPGDGSGGFVAVDSDVNVNVIFENNGHVTSNANLCNPFQNAEGGNSESVYDIESSTIATDVCFDDPFFLISYGIENNHLILSYPCIEACLGKFEKVLD